MTPCPSTRDQVQAHLRLIDHRSKGRTVEVRLTMPPNNLREEECSRAAGDLDFSFRAEDLRPNEHPRRKRKDRLQLHHTGRTRRFTFVERHVLSRLVAA
jgi:hypothetical protein